MLLGRASKKPDSRNCYPGPARPDCRASFFCPSPARRAKILSGHQAGPSLILCFFLPKPGPLLLLGRKFLPRPGPTACFGPTGWAIFGPGQAGLPMPRYTLSRPHHVACEVDFSCILTSTVALANASARSEYILYIFRNYKGDMCPR
jgi:hypothetical protein